MPTLLLTYAATLHHIDTDEEVSDLAILRAFDGHKDTTDLRELLSDDAIVGPMELTRISPFLRYREDKEQIRVQLVIESRRVIEGDDLKMLTGLLEEVLEAIWRPEFSFPNEYDEYVPHFEAMPDTVAAGK